MPPWAWAWKVPAVVLCSKSFRYSYLALEIRFAILSRYASLLLNVAVIIVFLIHSSALLILPRCASSGFVCLLGENWHFSTEISCHFFWNCSVVSRTLCLGFFHELRVLAFLGLHLLQKSEKKTPFELCTMISRVNYDYLLF